MKAVLLAAGRSFRMKPIEDKNALRFLGKPLIVHQLESLRVAGFSEILIVGGAHNKNFLQKVAREQTSTKMRVKYTGQKDLDLGMAGGVLAAASWIKNEPFLLVSGNDVVDGEIFNVIATLPLQGKQSQRLLRRFAPRNDKTGFMLAKKVSAYFPGGYLKVTRAGVITGIIEKPKPGAEPSSLINLVVHFHPQPKLLFEALKKEISIRPSGGEVKPLLPRCDIGASIRAARDDRYEHALSTLFKNGIAYRAIPYNGFWQPVKYPWHVLSLTEHFLDTLKPHAASSANIAKTAIIKGNVYIDEGARVLDNAIIHGPAYIGKNTTIANGALVRQSHIGDDCVIGFTSEIARSYVGDSVWTHTNYIGDSVIGSDVSFGSGGVTGNLRLDEGTIKVNVSKTWNGEASLEKVDTGRTKLGLITGDHIRIGINTSFMPGVKIGSNSCVGPGLTVRSDIPDESFVTGKWELEIKKNLFRIKPRI